MWAVQRFGQAKIGGGELHNELQCVAAWAPMLVAHGKLCQRAGRRLALWLRAQWQKPTPKIRRKSSRRAGRQARQGTRQLRPAQRLARRRWEDARNRFACAALEIRTWSVVRSSSADEVATAALRWWLDAVEVVGMLPPCHEYRHTVEASAEHRADWLRTVKGGRSADTVTAVSTTTPHSIHVRGDMTPSLPAPYLKLKFSSIITKIGH